MTPAVTEILRLTAAEYDTASKSAVATSAPNYGAIKLGEGEHLLRPGGTAGDSFVSFDRIFERYCVDSRRFQNVHLKALAEFVSNYGYVVRSKLHAVHAD